MTCYSRKIEEPKTRLDGWVNHVQMVINQMEAGDAREALLTAVDLLDRLTGVGGKELEDIEAGPARVSLAERDAAVSAARAEALERGIALGKAAAKKEIADILAAA